MRIYPAMCECDWLMIVMACACWLGEEYGYGWVCVCIWVGMGMGMCVGVRGGGLEGYVFCCDHLYYRLFFYFLFNAVCLFIVIICIMDSIFYFHVNPVCLFIN